MGFQNPIVGGTALRIPAIQSPNYSSGTTGWIVKNDGSAEFNNIFIRGSTMSQGIMLFYNGTPAAGNLVLSIAAVAGTDSFGNAYVAGEGLYGANAQVVAKDSAGNQSKFSGNVGGGGLLAALPGLAMQLAHNTGDPATVGALDDGSHTNLSLLLTSPSNAVGGIAGTNFSQINMIGADSAPCEIDLTAQVVSVGGTSFDANGKITSYGNDSFTTYTPAVGGTWGATFSTRTGWYMKVGKMVFVNSYLVVSGAGSGSGIVTVDMPSSVDRTTRQVLTMHTESTGPNGSHIGDGQAVFLVGGSGATADRLRTSSNDGTNRDLNLTGADLLAGGILVLQGWYREA